jgi:Rrf2 family iron-sulfur cluster assembly transcriptional regulator
LKNKKVVTSRRGPGGGYTLNRKSSDISLFQIITAVDENIDQTQCAGSMNCIKHKPCTTHHVWTGLNKIIKDYMKSITIEDVITNQVIHNLHDARESKTHVS